MKIFAVYDSKAEAFLPPWIEKSAGTALRRFEATTKNPESDFGRFPADYTLFELGDWIETAGEIRMHNAKKNLGLALEYAAEEHADHERGSVAQIQKDFKEGRGVK